MNPLAKHLSLGIHPPEFSVRLIPLHDRTDVPRFFWPLSFTSYCTCYATVVFRKRRALARPVPLRKNGITSGISKSGIHKDTYACFASFMNGWCTKITRESKRICSTKLYQNIWSLRTISILLLTPHSSNSADSWARRTNVSTRPMLKYFPKKVIKTSSLSPSKLPSARYFSWNSPATTDAVLYCPILIRRFWYIQTASFQAWPRALPLSSCLFP